MTPDRFTCEEAFRRLDDYVDRELSSAEAEQVRAHLETCAICAREFDFEERVLARLKSRMRRIEAPSDLFERVARSLRSR